MTEVSVAIPHGWGEDLGIDVAEVLGAGFSLARYGRERNGREPAALDAEVLIPAGEPVSARILERMPRLRLISCAGTGVTDYVDIPAATARGVLVANVRDYAGETMAEYTLGLILALSRKIVAADRATRAGTWRPDDFIGTDMRGKTMGIIGFGSVGTRMAKLARCIGMEVICSTARPDPARAAIHGVQFHELEDLLRSSDVISVHVALTDSTRSLLGSRELGLVKEGALLINTARGAVIDDTALADALASARLGGAAIDVFDPEPIPARHPLRRFDNVILTPHIAAATTATLRRSFLECLDNIKEFRAGRFRNRVN